MQWEEKAAENLKLVFADELEFVASEDIARRLSKSYESHIEFNESVRQSVNLLPWEKVWIVVSI